MPTYTYRCLKCGHEFERFQSMSDEPVKRCERCRSKVQRVFHPVGIVLKGPGFYKTDHRASSKRSGGGDSSSSSDSSESKSDSKPDGKTVESKSSKDTKSSESKSSDTKGSRSSDRKSR